MKITKTQLRKMIKEELNEVAVMGEEEYYAAEQLATELFNQHGRELAARILGLATSQLNKL